MHIAPHPGTPHRWLVMIIVPDLWYEYILTPWVPSAYLWCKSRMGGCWTYGLCGMSIHPSLWEAHHTHPLIFPSPQSSYRTLGPLHRWKRVAAPPMIRRLKASILSLSHTCLPTVVVLGSQQLGPWWSKLQYPVSSIWVRSQVLFKWCLWPVYVQFENMAV